MQYAIMRQMVRVRGSLGARASDWAPRFIVADRNMMWKVDVLDTV